ncbi:acetylglucosaminylphosphatidylinositol deacetylase [Pigmentiphaga litoralis]|uniref:PIG-L deacetylase family protein n=1 Tax=Pigmentiphaga litoralis TaxID=516702 RepID=UPI00167B43A9|nr:PIG-L family deacetylase [Pigmentiphaga litoralis]GGX34529.1 acetylglucosaminylphosphatidylinositol deacetylase [Pigmentiphaga litoralis]
MGLVGNREIRAEGTPEAVWDAWPGLHALTAVDATTLLPHGCRAVVIAPHPDDEVLACGGLMRQWTDAGRDVVVVAVTDGGGSHTNSRRWTPTTLEAARRAERQAAMQEMGLASVPVLGLQLPDGGVTGTEAALHRALTAVLRPGDVVFATWRLDGHPDHEATGRAAADCCARAGLPLIELPVWMWHWAEPGDPRVPWHRLARVRLDPAQREAKRRAIAAHRTQVEADPTLPGHAVLPPWALARLTRDHEFVFV